MDTLLGKDTPSAYGSTESNSASAGSPDINSNTYTPTQLHTPQAAVSETSPLLNEEVRHESPSLLYYRLRILLYILLVIAIIIPGFFYLESLVVGIDRSALASVQTTVTSVTLLGLSNQGVDTKATGSVHIDYSAAKLQFHKILLQIGALVAGYTVTIQPTSPIQVYLKPPDQLKFSKFANILSPPLEVDVHSNTTTIFDLETTSTMDSLAAGWLTKYLFVKEAIFDVHAQFDADFSTKWFSIGNRPIDIYTKAVWKPALPAFNINNLKLDPTEDNQLDILALASVDFIKAVNFAFPVGELEVELSLKDCDDHFVPITSLKTGNIDIEPGTPVVFNVSGKLSSISDKLLKVCTREERYNTDLIQVEKYENVSPIGGLINSFLAGEKVRFFLNIIQIPLLPFWLSKLIKQFHIPLDVDIPIPQVNGLISNTSVDSFDLLVDEDKIHLDSNISMAINSPLTSVGFSVPSFEGNFQVFHEDTLIVSGKTERPGSVNLGKFLNISLDVLLQLGNTDEIEEVAKLLLQNETVLLTVKTKDAQVEVKLPIFLGKLNDLSWDHEFEVVLPSVSDFLYDIFFEVKSINVLNSTTDEIALALELQFLEHFLPFDVEIPVQLLSYQVRYMNKVIGTVAIENVKYFSDDFIFPATLTAYKSASNEIEDLISKYVSGFKGLQIDIINGYANIPESSTLSNVLLSVEIYNFTIPEISWSRGSGNDLKLGEDDVQGNESPFLIESTIFLLTSEVQLTIFNPISNRDIDGKLFKATAFYQDEEIGHIGNAEMMITPGIFVLQRLPFVVNPGVGGDILRKGLNHQLNVEMIALFTIEFSGEKFGSLDLKYNGSGVKTNVKL